MRFAGRVAGNSPFVTGGRTEDAKSRHAAVDIRASVGEIIASALGQSPGRVRIVACEPLLTVIVTGTRTPLERVLLGAGEPDLVRRGRDALRDALANPLRAAVERALGVTVDGVSGSHDPPTGTETLVFGVAAPPALLG